MDEPEMVERVARAICRPRCHGEAHPCDREGDGTCKPAACRDWFLYTEAARAAIEAMRDPTAGMVNAGGYACQAHCDLTMDAARASWAGMIDAALAEPTAPR